MVQSEFSLVGILSAGTFLDIQKYQDVFYVRKVFQNWVQTEKNSDVEVKTNDKFEVTLNNQIHTIICIDVMGNIISFALSES